MVQEDLSQEWCQNIAKSCAVAGVTLSPRNTDTHYPMYGCTVDSTSRPFIVAGVFFPDACQLQSAVVESLVHWNFTSCLSVGHGLRIPLHPSSSTITRMLPLLCSINPMGTPCFGLRGRRDELKKLFEVELDAENQEVGKYVIRILQSLKGDHFTVPVHQNEVGAMVYGATSGKIYGMHIWISWINKWNANDTIPRVELIDLYSQWNSFAVIDHSTAGYDASARLLTIAEQNLSMQEYHTLVCGLAQLDHADRIHTDKTVQMMGSMTHADLARYISHQLKGSVVCSTAALSTVL